MAMSNADLSAMARRLARAAVTDDKDYSALTEHYKSIDRDTSMIIYDLEDGIRLTLGLEVN